MKKSKDPPDFREQWSVDELRKHQERRKRIDYHEKSRFLKWIIILINIVIGAAIAWALWLTFKFLIEKGII